MQSESIANLAKAISEAQKKLKPVAKDCDNPFYKSKYADLASVWDALRPFHEQGVAITQSPMVSEHPGHIALKTQLTHISGEWMASVLELPVVKNDPQGFGSALTYARRYALGCMTGVVTEEDDDGNAASHPPKRLAYTDHRKEVARKMHELSVEPDGVDTSERASAQQGSDAAPPNGEEWTIERYSGAFRNMTDTGAINDLYRSAPQHLKADIYPAYTEAMKGAHGKVRR